MNKWVVLSSVLMLIVLLPETGSTQTPVPPADRAGKPTIAVVLSGGGALGFAHNGVLEVIEELGIPVDMVVGTSMGALIGGFYAAGYSPWYIREVSAAIDWPIMFSDTIPRRFYGYRERARSEQYVFEAGIDREGVHLGSGLIAGQNIVALFDRLSLRIPANVDFDTLPRRYRAVAADVITGEQIVLDSGSLSDAMRASMGIPGLFRPYHLGDRYLIDGGVVNNMPVDVARSMGADIVIAVEIRQPMEVPVKRLLRSPFAAVEQSTKILIEANVRPQRPLADLVIEPDLDGFTLGSFTEAIEIMDRGEAAARRALPALQALAGQIALVRPLHEVDRSAGVYFADLDLPIPSRVRIEGGNATERELAQRRFERFLHRPIVPEELISVVDQTYTSGRFDLVKTHVLREPDGSNTLLVTLQPSVESRTRMQFGMRYSGAIGASSYSKMVLTQNLTVHDITGWESYWSTDLSIVNILAVETAYFQPLGTAVYLQPSIGYLADSDRYSGFGPVGSVVENREFTGGLILGLILGQFGEMSGGFRYTLFESSSGNSGDGREWTPISELVAAIGADSRDSRLFPGQGSAVEVEYSVTLPWMGSKLRFQRVGTAAESHLRLHRRVSVGALIAGELHLDVPADEAATLNRYQSSALGDERVFIGYRNNSQRGLHRLAIAGEVRIALDQTPGTLTAHPVIVLDAGVVDTWQTDSVSLTDVSLNWTSSVGLGARFSDSFAALLRIGLVREFQPFVALNLGAFGF